MNLLNIEANVKSFWMQEMCVKIFLRRGIKVARLTIKKVDTFLGKTICQFLK